MTNKHVDSEVMQRMCAVTEHMAKEYARETPSESKASEALSNLGKMLVADLVDANFKPDEAKMMLGELFRWFFVRADEERRFRDHMNEIINQGKN